MEAAMKSTALAVLLFSTEYFQRDATIREAQLLSARHAQHHVQLLPVFLRMNVDECKRSLAGILGEVRASMPTGIRHLGETTMQPGLDQSLPKTVDERLWHIVHAVSILLRKDFKAGVASYAASSRQQGSR